MAVPVPAMISEETFDAAQHRLHRNVQMVRRNNTTYAYLLRGLVSCGQCRRTCGGRTLHPGYHDYFCRGRPDALRRALGERCTARYAPAQVLDALVWQDLCRVLSDPTLITHELERAQMGAWLPQALHARRQTLRDVLAQLERQQARLLDVSLAEVIKREAFARRRKEVAQSQQGLTQPLRQLDTQAQQHVNVATLSQGIEAFCQRLQPTLDQLTFAQRRPLVAWLIDRVIVNDTQVKIRYVVPTGPTGETTPFCHLRLDYLNPTSFALQATGVRGCSPMRDQIERLFLPLCPTTNAHHRPIRFPGKQPLRYLKEGSWLATRPQGVETQGLAVPPRRPVATRAAHLRPAGVLHGVLPARPLACALAKAHPLRPLRDQPAHQLDQGDMEVLGQVSLRPLAHPPGQRQGSALIDHMDHQGVAPAPHDAAIHDEPHRL